MKTGDLARVRAEYIDLEGQSVSRLANTEVCCVGLFPGELANVRIEATSRHHPRAFARLQKLEEAHPARRVAPCRNHVSNGGGCTGCALMELTENAQRAAKRDMLAQAFGLHVSEVEAAPAALGYRLSSKRVALSIQGQLTLGSYTRGSHQPAAMPGCLVDHPRLVQAFAEVERAARRLQIAPYDETQKRGDLRYVWAKTNGEQVIVTLVVASTVSRAGELLSGAIENVDGVLVSVQDATSNALRGSPARLANGVGEVGIQLLGQRVEVGALGFLQPNPQVAEAAYRALLGEPAAHASKELVFDLYAGAGLTTAELRNRFQHVVPCEAFPESAERLGVPAMSVEEFLELELRRDPPRVPALIVANPPRKGLGERVTRALNQLGARELRIMSCGPLGLARDIAQLTTGEGRYVVKELRAFDTLPQTPHVELVVTLDRRA